MLVSQTLSHAELSAACGCPPPPGPASTRSVCAGTATDCWPISSCSAGPKRATGGPAAGTGGINISTTIKPNLKVGETVIELVEVGIGKESGRRLDMPIITVGVPPGCDVDMDEFEGLVGKHGVERVERAQREVVFYLTAIEQGALVQLPIWFTPRFPMTVQIPAARVYEYYQPERGAEAPARTLTVRRVSEGDDLGSP